MVEEKVEVEENFRFSYRERNDPNKKQKMILKFRPFVYGGLGIITLVFFIGTMVFFTSEQEIGFTSIFGNTSIIEGAGIHFKVPFFSSKEVFDATTKGMAIGYNEESNESEEEDSVMITSDLNLVNIDFFIQYRITDSIEYHYSSNDPEGILRNIAKSSIRNTVGLYDVDAVMTTRKAEIEAEVFEDIIQELTYHETGLTVTSVAIQDSEPPTTTVAKAFKDVENAKTAAETAVNNANSYRNTEIAAADAEVEAIKQEANATKTERVNEAKEEVAKFEALFEEYQNNPDTVKKRLYYEALEEILPNMEMIIGKDFKVIYVKDSSNPIGAGVAVSEATSKTGNSKTTEKSKNEEKNSETEGDESNTNNSQKKSEDNK